MKTSIVTMAFLMIYLLTVIHTSGQTKISSGEYQVIVETNMTEEQARTKAKDFAIINAIENAFGSYAELQTEITIKDGREDYSIYAGRKVKGDWLKTLDGPKFEEHTSKYEENGEKHIENYITCKIKGKVRKATPKARIIYHTLKCSSLNCKTEAFNSDDSLYVYFESPIDGYVSIFLEDEDKVYRLFPYTSMTGSKSSAAVVKEDIRYIFFSNKPGINLFEDKADYFTLFTKKDSEINQVYIIFSEERYIKPSLNDVEKIEHDQKELILPRSLSKKEFQKWLAYNRGISTSFLVAKNAITIYSE